MEPRVSFITLGVANVGEARSFYERLGLKVSSASQDGVAFFNLGGVVLSLFGRDALAEDAGVQRGDAGSARMSLAHNVASEAQVDEVLEEAVAAGAKLLKRGQAKFWGGYSGYFADPDGHLWEVAFNPFMPLDAEGRVTLPGPVE